MSTNNNNKSTNNKNSKKNNKNSKKNKLKDNNTIINDFRILYTDYQKMINNFIYKQTYTNIINNNKLSNIYNNNNNNLNINNNNDDDNNINSNNNHNNKVINTKELRQKKLYLNTYIIPLFYLINSYQYQKYLYKLKYIKVNIWVKDNINFLKNNLFNYNLPNIKTINVNIYLSYFPNKKVNKSKKILDKKSNNKKPLENNLNIEEIFTIDNSYLNLLITQLNKFDTIINIIKQPYDILDEIDSLIQKLTSSFNFKNNNFKIYYNIDYIKNKLQNFYIENLFKNLNIINQNLNDIFNQNITKDDTTEFKKRKIDLDLNFKEFTEKLSSNEIKVFDLNKLYDITIKKYNQDIKNLQKKVNNVKKEEKNIQDNKQRSLKINSDIKQKKSELQSKYSNFRSLYNEINRELRHSGNNNLPTLSNSISQNMIKQIRNIKIETNNSSRRRELNRKINRLSEIGEEYILINKKIDEKEKEKDTLKKKVDNYLKKKNEANTSLKEYTEYYKNEIQKLEEKKKNIVKLNLNLIKENFINFFNTCIEVSRIINNISETKQKKKKQDLFFYYLNSDNRLMEILNLFMGENLNSNETEINEDKNNNVNLIKFKKYDDYYKNYIEILKNYMLKMQNKNFKSNELIANITGKIKDINSKLHSKLNNKVYRSIDTQTNEKGGLLGGPSSSSSETTGHPSSTEPALSKIATLVQKETTPTKKPEVQQLSKEEKQQKIDELYNKSKNLENKIKKIQNEINKEKNTTIKKKLEEEKIKIDEEKRKIYNEKRKLIFQNLRMPTKKQKNEMYNKSVKRGELPHTGGSNKNYETYKKMKKSGVPEGAIRQKMTIDGISNKEINNFFKNNSTLSTDPSTSSPELSKTATVSSILPSASTTNSSATPTSIATKAPVSSSTLQSAAETETSNTTKSGSNDLIKKILKYLDLLNSKDIDVNNDLFYLKILKEIDNYKLDDSSKLFIDMIKSEHESLLKKINSRISLIKNNQNIDQINQKIKNNIKYIYKEIELKERIEQNMNEYKIKLGKIYVFTYTDNIKLYLIALNLIYLYINNYYSFE